MNTTTPHTRPPTPGTHGGHLVPVEDQRDVGAAVVQVARVGLALGGRGREQGARGGTDPPLVAGGREAGEVAVLQALPARGAQPAHAPARLLASWGALEQTGEASAQHLVPGEEGGRDIQWSS